MHPIKNQRRRSAPVAERHIIFLGDLVRNSVREACAGAAEHIAEHPSWVFNPWSLQAASASAPTPADMQMVSGILTTEESFQRVRRSCGRLKAPVVYFYFMSIEPHTACDTVSIDDLAVGEMAAEHLWDRGYRQFAFIGSSEAAWSKGREKGFERWLGAMGTKPGKHLFSLPTLPVDLSSNLVGRNQTLQELVSALPKPCGVMAANDAIACFVLHAARLQRCRVPEDLGVVGVDNDPLPNAAAGLAISSVELPFREVGRQAARLLGERWRGRRAACSIRLPPIRVVVRASTDAFMTEHPVVRKAQFYIESRRTEWMSVKDVARAVGTTQVTLGRHFQRELNTTPSDYLRRRRIAHASERLRQGEAKVYEVAAACGYSSTSYFGRVFKQLTGQRPGSLRHSRP
jgi:LacI family transcriptional regulator